ncbi:MAG: hypothetical protein ACKVTZ_24065 [Bacteroidia bacterium]
MMKQVDINRIKNEKVTFFFGAAITRNQTQKPLHYFHLCAKKRATAQKKTNNVSAD